MEDDPREVDWAERKIRELTDQLRALSSAVGDVSQLEDNVTVIVELKAQGGSIDNLYLRLNGETKSRERIENSIFDRIIALEEQLTIARQWQADMGQGLAGRMEALEKKVEWVQTTSGEATDRDARIARDGERINAQRLNELESALNAQNDRVSQIESRLNAYGVPMVRGEYTDQRPVEEFSPPIGGTGVVLDKEPPIVVSNSRSGGPSYKRWQEMFAGGKLETAGGVVPYPSEKIRRMALEGAAQRVRDYMAQRRFGEHVIEAVLERIIGAERSLPVLADEAEHEL